MTDKLPQWALDKAQAFSDRHYGMSRASQRELAALLVEVAQDKAAYAVGYADCAAEVRRVVEEVLADHWPADVFTPPEKGQHGATVDACSAAALRAVVPRLRAEILARLEALK